MSEPGAAADSGAAGGADEPSVVGPAGLEPVAFELAAALEAVLMVVEEPVPELVLAQVLERPTEEVRATLAGLAAGYDRDRRGFELRSVGGGWRLYTRADYAPYVERFVLSGQQARLSQAALETLAVVAYSQPVSRARVAAVRGVDVDSVMRTLQARELVEETGTDPRTGAVLYATTPRFLERLGIERLEELPELAPLLPGADSAESLADS